MLQKVYDACGAWAAKRIVRTMEVLVLQAGRELEPTKDSLEHTWSYELSFRGFGQPG